jgi:AAHS family 4-hydroxybenzoate transporter-like MFS transporter
MSQTAGAGGIWRLSGLQWRVAFLCMLAQIFDGFDISSISMAAPALIKAWGVPPPTLAPTFVMSSIGIMIGALASGPVGDRIGRKPVLIASLFVLGLSSLACTQASAVSQLAWLRLFTGMGIGMLLPSTVALSSDYLPEKIRAAVVMIVFTGAPLGGFAGKILVAQLLPVYGWTSIFWVGGIAPLVLIPVLLLGQPESPLFLMKRGRLDDAARARLHGMGIDLAAHQSAATGNPVSGLFKEGLSATTILVWIMFFSNLLSMYLIGYWMPTILSLSGLKPADAVFASSFGDAGPLVSIFMVAPLSVRFGATHVIQVFLFLGIIFIGMVGLLHLPYAALITVIFLIGWCTVGSQTGLNGMVGALYPVHIRNTGMAWALGIGRLGAIVGPYLGGLLLGAGLPPRQIFLMACVTASIATLSVFGLGLVNKRRALEAVTQQA